MPHRPFGQEEPSSLQQVDIKASDLELGTLSKLQKAPSTSGTDLLIRPRGLRINLPEQ